MHCVLWDIIGVVAFLTLSRVVLAIKLNNRSTGLVTVLFWPSHCGMLIDYWYDITEYKQEQQRTRKLNPVSYKFNSIQNTLIPITAQPASLIPLPEKE